MNKGWPAHTRLFTFVTCALIAAGLILMITLFYRMQHTILSRERRQMLAVVQSTARSMDNYIAGRIAAATLLQEEPSFAALPLYEPVQ